ncbi:hypothetical protein [Neisseria dentiae]|uniref:hypothetical protein n=1 Tax=Neisseria dentiae TaxID=194197 RepID=UPI0035A0A9DC
MLIRKQDIALGNQAAFEGDAAAAVVKAAEKQRRGLKSRRQAWFKSRYDCAAICVVGRRRRGAVFPAVKGTMALIGAAIIFQLTVCGKRHLFLV